MNTPLAVWSLKAQTSSFFSPAAAGSLRGRFARSAGWSIAGAVTSQALGLAASVFTARLLGNEAFGELGMIQTTVGTFGIFAGLGLGLTATKSVAELRDIDPERAGRIIGLSSATATMAGGIISVLLFVFAPFLAVRSLGAPSLTMSLQVSSGFLFLNALIGMQTGVLAGLEAFRTIAYLNLARGLLTFPITVVGVLFWHLPGAVWALVVTAAVGWLLNHLTVQRECRKAGVPIRFKKSWGERSILWSFSVPAFLGSAVAGPATWAASALLVNRPGGYVQMGIFSVASQWRTAAAFIPSTLSQPLLAMLSSMYGKSEMKAYRKLAWANICFVFLITTLSAAAIALAAPWIVKAYGSEFSAAAPVLVLVMIATVISSTASVVGQIIASAARMWAGLALNSIWATALLLFSFLLVSRFGALGLAYATLGAYLIHGLMVGGYTWVTFGKQRNR